jgi:hypothetical protein
MPNKYHQIGWNERNEVTTLQATTKRDATRRFHGWDARKPQNSGKTKGLIGFSFQQFL